MRNATLSQHGPEDVTYVGGAQHPLALRAELDRHPREGTARGNLSSHDDALKDATLER